VHRSQPAVGSPQGQGNQDQTHDQKNPGDGQENTPSEIIHHYGFPIAIPQIEVVLAACTPLLKRISVALQGRLRQLRSCWFGSPGRFIQLGEYGSQRSEDEQSKENTEQENHR
jgi:hypothetical protein